LESKNHDGRSGASTESLFDYEAQERGLIVSKPVYDTVYDRIVDCSGRLIRVQIKMTSFVYYNQFKVGKGMQKYKDRCDVLGVYIKPEGNWYFIPVSELPSGQLNISQDSKYSKYLNNWEVFDAN
jgi:hypothetical protein